MSGGGSGGGDMNGGGSDGIDGVDGGGGGTAANVGDKQASGSASTVITFTIENLLYTAVLTAVCWFSAHYFVFLRIPALVFIFVDSVSVMASVHAVSTILIFSVRPKRVGGAFSDCVLAESSQGFAIVSSLMWLGVLWCMFLDVPRIAAVPGFPASASAIAIAIVLGFSVVIPFLALVVTYAAVPSGSGNSLVFNGSTLGAACLLFFVTISFGNGGVMKCSPYEDTSSRMLFFILVLSYWGALLLLDIIVFLRWDPLESVWVLLGNNADSYYNFVDFFQLSWMEINFWRIIGCILNVVIVATSLLYTQLPQQTTVMIVMIVVAGLHVPMIVKIKIDVFGGKQEYQNTYEWDGEDDVQPVPQYDIPIAYAASYQNNHPGAVATFPNEQMYVHTPQAHNDLPIKYQQSGMAGLFPFNVTKNNSTLSTGKRSRRFVDTVDRGVF